MSDFDEFSPTTRAVRAGQIRSPEAEHSELIYATSSFVFDSAAEAAARFAGESPGNIYSRFTNPTVRMFEQRLAAMEGGERCVGTSSGMSAILSTCMGLLEAGDHIVSSRAIFGTTVNLFNKILSKFGLATSFVPLTDYDAWEAAIRPETKMLFLETPSNPLTEIADIERLADIAHRHDCLLVVDNCFCTPILQQPFKYGADIVIHSATKYLDGQGRCVGGAVIGPQEMMEEHVFGFLRTAGPTMSPFNAWVFLKGLETLGVRMRAHSDSANQLAHWLAEQSGVEKVYYPGLKSHAQHDLASRQQSGFGGIVSFEVSGGRERAWQLIDRLRLFSITANLGDTKSTVTHPATTTHSRLSDAERAAAGIGDGLVRLSAGLEDVGDLQADLAAALAAR
ncbi:O-succinylhomoserine sulfhydrylase [Methylohalomonas lacus]|uniref:O-succinylhomoserine sulfhydrylase n=1 Tax=Methylohalomonas lacus TaxID=398773 RepID=A0AAE3HNB6_9GAMM|nr:O-succinylhomoserine sulfhydrylase [Methylohalomonas lacus]MCS3903752.1 O-succinylhomoserine sulfhydrylase [Methylohalomonas lacus]